MILYGIANRTEDDALLGKVLLKGGLYRHRVHNGVYSHTAQRQSLLKRYAELVECLHQLRVYLLLLVRRLLGKRVGIVGNRLVVYLGHMHVRPCWLLKLLPVAESLEAELQHPVGFALLLRDQSNDILVQAFLYDVGMHIGSKAVLVFLVGHLSYIRILCIFIFHFALT